MADGYVRQRHYYGDLSGSVEVGALTPGSVLATPRKQSRIFVQRIQIVVSGMAAGTWDVQDSVTGQSLLPGGPLSVAATQNLIVDLGANGLGLTPLANLVFVNNGAGAVGSLTWDAYCKLRTDVPVTP